MTIRFGKILQFTKKLTPRPSTKHARTLEDLIHYAYGNPKLNLAEKGAMRLVKEAEAVLRRETPHLWDAFIGGRLSHVEMTMVLAAATFRIQREWTTLISLIGGTVVGAFIIIGVIWL